LLLTDCNVNSIMNNPKLEIVLKNKSRFINSEKPFKLNLGAQEVECKPSFRYKKINNLKMNYYDKFFCLDYFYIQFMTQSIFRLIYQHSPL
jgi:hypothetical protein